MKIKPLNGLTLIKRDSPRVKSDRILLPVGVAALEQRSRDLNPGTVIAVADPGWVRHAGESEYVWRVPTLKPGDRVFCGPRVDNAITSDLCLMHEKRLQLIMLEE